MHQIINILQSKILKIYNTSIFICLKSKELPKCIIRFIIVRFCNSVPFEEIELIRVYHGTLPKGPFSDYCDKTFCYPVYYSNKFYSSTYQFYEKHLIINNCDSNNKNYYIDQKFSAHPTLLLFKYNSLSNLDEDDILTIIEIIGSLYEFRDMRYTIIIPLFGKNYIKIMKQHKNALIAVVQAEMTLIKLNSEKKRIKEIISLI